MVSNFDNFELVHIDLNRREHQNALLQLMNDYMLDDMGLKAALPEDLKGRLIDGLSLQNNYLGFLLKFRNEYVALANCFIGFSTFKAKQLINIHDFIVSPSHRNRGAGNALLNLISAYACAHHFCKITLEVRHDNHNAQKLYTKNGFAACKPPMYFWQKEV